MITPVLRAKILIPLIFTTLTLLLSFSYYTTQRFAGAGDRVIYDVKQSKLAQQIRIELLKHADTQAVRFKSLDDVELSGIYLQRKNAKGNVLLCHGYKGGKEFMFGLLKVFPDYNILTFDFRAHGQSKGLYISLGCHEYKDVIAAVNFLKKNSTQNLPTILLGISMGGSSCIKAIEHEPNLCDALIVDSSFSDLRKMFLRGFAIKAGLPHYPFFPLMRTMFHYCANCDVNQMSPVQSVKHVKQPIMFIHSCDDVFIPPEESLKLYAHARHKKSKIWIGPRCRHGWLHTYFPYHYQKKVHKFLQKTVFTRSTLPVLSLTKGSGRSAF